jgi:hypothetical protein
MMEHDMSNMIKNNHKHFEVDCHVGHVTKNYHKDFEMNCDMDHVIKKTHTSIDMDYDMWHVAKLNQYVDDFATGVIIIQKIIFKIHFEPLNEAPKKNHKKKMGI